MSLTSEEYLQDKKACDEMWDRPGKSLRVFVFENGVGGREPTRLVLNKYTCRNMEQLRHTISKRLKLNGIPRYIFDAQTYSTLLDLSALRDGHNLLASLRPSPIRLPYPLRLHIRSPSHSRKHTLQKDMFLITVYKNGDAFFTGLKVTVTRWRFRTLETFLAYLDGHLGLTTVIKKLISLRTGSTVHGMEDLKNGEQVVAVGTGEPYINMDYDVDRYFTDDDEDDMVSATSQMEYERPASSKAGESTSTTKQNGPPNHETLPSKPATEEEIFEKPSPPREPEPFPYALEPSPPIESSPLRYHGEGADPDPEERP